ncbi:DUF6668 family protein (plasmid) [Nocardia sp. CA-084685]|uniref:DUF6668 family protein n=1 Tax=Nocardia sp. CA-084685 TaxID=3239970 RepID=UPI003D961962
MAAPIAHGEGGTTPEVPAGLNVPSVSEQAPIWHEPLTTTTPAPAFWVLGAHGGAGASTLTQTWAPAADSQRGWPAADRYPHVVIVARTHRTGLAAAHVLLRQAAARLTGGCKLLGLVTIADAPGALPNTLRRQRDLVEELAPQSWRIPYLGIYRQLPLEQMPQWCPRDQPPEHKRFSRPDPDTVHPQLAEIGTDIFQAARNATSR